MPEDQVEVTEQTTTEAPDQGNDFESGVAAALLDDEDAPVTKQEEESEPVEEKPGAEVKGEAKEETLESDEDEDRGKALLTAEKERADADAASKAKAAEDERLRKQSEGQPRSTALSPLDQETADILMSFADPKLFGNVKAGDMDLDLQDYVKANPEVALVAGAMFNNMLSRLMAAGIIPTTDVLKEKFGDAWDSGIPGRFGSVEDRLFTTEIMSRGVPEDPETLISEPEFKPWFEGQKDEIKALFRSNDPRDHAKALKRYVRTRTASADGERQVIVDKNNTRREKQNKVFSGMAGRGGSKAGGKSVGGGDDGDFQDGMQKALSED